MKPANAITCSLMTWALTISSACAQGFSSGSDGSYGALNVTVNTNIALPPNGKLNCTTITIVQGAALTFSRNLLNTPVYLLATGDVIINGAIDVSGGNSGGSPPVGGPGGPGGFDGGLPGIDTSSIPPGAGYGPGAGKGGVNSSVASSAGAGGYGSAGSGGSSANHGVLYGSPLLVPLVGGSGGGGCNGSPGNGGGGGGGAILIASTTKIVVNGALRSQGGSSYATAYSGGSGGAIRLVAPQVTGNGSINVYGANGGGYGRVRIDALDRSALNLSINPNSSASVGAAMFLFPSPLPKLDILQAAGTTIPEGNATPVIVVLPFGTTTNQTVTVQARDFTGIVPINLVLTPENGVPTTYPAQIDMSTGNPATTAINVGFPINVRTVVNAWTR